MVRNRISVKGRVQGVGYRYFCQNIADVYELTGWVKNLPDQSVEIEIQGEEENVELFKKELKMGPSQAKVSEVISHEIESARDETSFVINF